MGELDRSSTLLLGFLIFPIRCGGVVSRYQNSSCRDEYDGNMRRGKNAIKSSPALTLPQTDVYGAILGQMSLDGGRYCQLGGEMG